MTDSNSTETHIPKIWHFIDQGSTASDPGSKEKIHQMYSNVADLYHEFRPKYPESLVDEAIRKSPLLSSNPRAKILELGCGPGTVTMTLAKRGFEILSIDPGVGMIAKARQVCSECTNVEFRQESFKDFDSKEGKFDAIVAASSLHWALADSDKNELIEKLAKLLKEDGTLILFWNFPPEPSDDILGKVADALQKPKPFYFGNGSLQQHWKKLQERVLGPVEDSPFFDKFETTEFPLQEQIPMDSYVNFLKTLSNYITMESDEQESFFATVKKVFREECGELIPTSRKSILNVSQKVKAMNYEKSN